MDTISLASVSFVRFHCSCNQNDTKHFVNKFEITEDSGELSQDASISITISDVNQEDTPPNDLAEDEMNSERLQDLRYRQSGQNNEVVSHQPVPSHRDT